MPTCSEIPCHPVKDLPSLAPLILEGEHVRLEPLSLAHLDALCEVGLDEMIWKWYTHTMRSRYEMAVYIRAALDGQARGEMLPFATVARAGDAVVGSTRFMNIDLPNRRMEIGSTWIAPPWQRTAINTEAKLLMLGYAFETIGCHRVELKTDALNEPSRRAIRRLGAKEEGVLRKHMVTASGRLRDSVYYSITDDEWPDVQSLLVARLAAHRDKTGGGASSRRSTSESIPGAGE